MNLPRPATGRRVPWARRAMFADRRRAALAAGGVAAALLLALMLQGILDGAMRQVTAYLRSSPADVIVAQQGARTMHMSVSALDPATTSRVAGVDGAAWAEAIRYTTTVLAGPDGTQQLSYVIGYDPASGRGGPSTLASGRAPGAGEIIVERVAVDRLGLRLGDTATVFGAPFRVVGTFRGGTTIANTMAFVTTDDFAAHRGSAVAFVLVGARPGVGPEDLAARVGAAVPGATVQTRDAFVAEEASLVRDMSADLLQIISAVAFLIALAVIALTLFTLTLAKLREHAVVKALGAPARRLVAVVLAQAVWLVTVAVALATALALALGAVVARVNPVVSVVVEPREVARVGLTALLIGVAGAVAPLRRVIGVDPAAAFRRA